MDGLRRAPSLEWVRRTYNEHARDGSVDPYHQHTHAELDAFVNHQLTANGVRRGGIVLNIGSGGKRYTVAGDKQVLLDVAEDSLPRNCGAVAADAENLPISDNSVDWVLSIGCVLNYCDAVALISEASRVLKAGGKLILDWERAHCWEFYGTETMDQSVAPVKTFYNGKTHYLWVYSDEYVHQVLRAAGFAVVRSHHFHLVSQAVFRFWEAPGVAAKLALADRILRMIRPLRARAGHVISLCQKT